MIEMQPVTLPSDVGDEAGMLIFHEGRLIAVLSCLGDIHGDLAGHWFVETRFGPPSADVVEIFATVEEARLHLISPRSE